MKRCHDGMQEYYEQKLLEQGGVCAICCEKRRLVIDYDLVSSEARGLLCLRCNKILERFLDRVDLLVEEVNRLRRLDSEV